MIIDSFSETIISEAIIENVRVKLQSMTVSDWLWQFFYI